MMLHICRRGAERIETVLRRTDLDCHGPVTVERQSANRYRKIARVLEDERAGDEQHRTFAPTVANGLSLG